MEPPDLAPVFQAFKALLEPYAIYLRVLNTPQQFYLETYKLAPNRKPWMFGAARLRKNYVSYHLMPVYRYPDLLEQISPKLRQRMHGKACFNFRRVDLDNLAELQALTQRGFERFQQEGWINPQPPANAIP